MNKKFAAGGALAGLALTGALVGSVSAQTAADATGLSEEQAIEIALLEVPGAPREENEGRRGDSCRWRARPGLRGIAGGRAPRDGRRAWGR